METANFEALIITLGIVGLVGIVAWLIYAVWTKWLEAKHGQLHKQEIKVLEERIYQLELQIAARTENRLNELESKLETKVAFNNLQTEMA